MADVCERDQRGVVRAALQGATGAKSAEELLVVSTRKCRMVAAATAMAVSVLAGAFYVRWQALPISPTQSRIIEQLVQDVAQQKGVPRETVRKELSDSLHIAPLWDLPRDCFEDALNLLAHQLDP